MGPFIVLSCNNGVYSPPSQQRHQYPGVCVSQEHPPYLPTSSLSFPYLIFEILVSILSETRQPLMRGFDGVADSVTFKDSRTVSGVHL